MAASDQHHEVLRAFEALDRPLSAPLREMLDELPKHRTERRGCGYTQSTRYLAPHVNRPRRPRSYAELSLFADRDGSRLRALLDGAKAAGVKISWRGIDRRPPPEPMRGDAEWCALYEREAAWQASLRALPEALEREESRLLARMIADVVLEPDEAKTWLALEPWPEKQKIGTCPLAEKYFLELAHETVRRKGRMNVIVSDDGEPLMVEKLNLGDDHSCFTVAPVSLNGVRIPPGSLMGVTYGDDVRPLRDNRALPGAVIPASTCAGFRFLRYTTLVVEPAIRARAFTAHLEAQIHGVLFTPDKATVAQVREQALKQL